MAEKKTGVVIILYNPELKRLKQNLDSIAKQAEEVVCIDNGSENIDRVEQLLGEYAGVVCIRNKKNRGIAAALNQGMAHCQKNGKQWVLTLDQDSVCPVNLLESLERHVNLDKRIAVVCPGIYNEGQGMVQSRGVPCKGREGLKSIEYTITSGCLMSIEKWEAVGKFDERLFIDLVDTDICKRIRRLGFLIIEDSGVVMRHQVGSTKTRHILWRTVYAKNHSPFRKYYMMRNGIYLYKKKEMPAVVLIKYIVREYLLVILYEKNKIKKLRRMNLGIWDGIKMQTEK